MHYLQLEVLYQASHAIVTRFMQQELKKMLILRHNDAAIAKVVQNILEAATVAVQNDVACNEMEVSK